jgi:hypothetical protein
MNGLASLRSPWIAGAIAAAILISSVLLPCEVAPYASASYLDFVTSLRGQLSGLEWLLLGLLALGSGLAVIGLAMRVRRPNDPTGLWVAFAGFCCGLAGELVWVLDFSGHSGEAQRLDVSLGPGVWIGAAAAIVGIVASLRGAVAGPPPEASVAQPATDQWAAMFAKPEQMHGAERHGGAPVPAFANAQPSIPTADAPARQPPDQPGAPIPPMPALASSLAQAGFSPTFGQSDARPTQTVGPARMTYMEGGRQISVLVTPGRRLTIGRDPSAEIRLSDPRVSRRHATLERRDGKWLVTDLLAANSTRLRDANGEFQTIYGQVSIESGQLLIGDVLVTLLPD